MPGSELTRVDWQRQWGIEATHSNRAERHHPVEFAQLYEAGVLATAGRSPSSAFLSNWEGFLRPLIVTDRMEMRRVEVGIAMFQSLYTRKRPYQMAAAVTVMVPMIVVFGLAQRHFTRGISLTGMKG